MQYLPDLATEPMRDRPDGGLIAQPWQQTPAHRLKMAAFLLDRRVGAWFSTRRRLFVPLGGAAVVVHLGALSLPGQVPTQEVNSAAEANVLACTPTSEIPCCAESTPKPGTSASRITAS